MDLLLHEVAKLGGVTLKLAGPLEIPAAIGRLVEEERIRKAVVWRTEDVASLRLEEALAQIGVDVVDAELDKTELAECDLGVTVVDAALPETGTLVLRARPGARQAVSLLPRVHLAIVQGAALRADLQPVLDEIKADRRVHFITGPSRTADIEKTLAIGVHGPQRLHVWAIL